MAAFLPSPSVEQLGPHRPPASSTNWLWKQTHTPQLEIHNSPPLAFPRPSALNRIWSEEKVQGFRDLFGRRFFLPFEGVDSTFVCL